MPVQTDLKQQAINLNRDIFLPAWSVHPEPFKALVSPQQGQELGWWQREEGMDGKGSLCFNCLLLRTREGCLKENDQEQSAEEVIRGGQGSEFTMRFSNPSLALIPTYRNIHNPQNILSLGDLERSSSSCKPSPAPCSNSTGALYFQSGRGIRPHIRDKLV